MLLFEELIHKTFPNTSDFTLRERIAPNTVFELLANQLTGARRNLTKATDPPLKGNEQLIFKRILNHKPVFGKGELVKKHTYTNDMTILVTACSHRAYIALRNTQPSVFLELPPLAPCYGGQTPRDPANDTNICGRGIVSPFRGHCKGL